MGIHDQKQSPDVRLFQKFYVAVERETRLSLKAVHSHNWDKYTGLFEKYYRKHGIKYDRTVPKTL